MVCHPNIVINICIPHSIHLFRDGEVCYFLGEQPELNKFRFRKRKNEEERERVKRREKECRRERKNAEREES